jgi:hypothetical protein
LAARRQGRAGIGNPGDRGGFGINADGAFALTITIGPAPGLVIETDKNLLPIVKTEVSNDRLGRWARQVRVSSPHVAEIEASGSNQIDGEALTGEKLSISPNGTNRAVLTGNGSRMTAQLSGSNYFAGSTDIVVNGSGVATVDAHQRIVAQISGAASVSVYGNPRERRTRVNRAGRIAVCRMKVSPPVPRAPIPPPRNARPGGRPSRGSSACGGGEGGGPNPMGS